MVEEISDSFSMVPLIALIASTDSWVAAWMPDDLLADLAGRLRGLLGERLYLGSHDREAAAGFAGARRLDGGVERQQVGLPRDGVDQFDDVADAGCRLRQFADAVVGGAGLIDGLAGHPRRFLHLAADLVDGRGHLLGGRCHRLHVGRGLLGGRRDGGREFLRAFGGRRERTRRDFELDRTPTTRSRRSRPTAVSKSSAILCMSALRPATARVSAARCSASSAWRATALLLNTSTALAISPISSPRPMPDTSTSRLPLARVVHGDGHALQRAR